MKNLGLFVFGGMACLAFAGAGQPGWAVLSVAGAVLLHLLSVPLATKEAMLLAISAVIGLAWESALVSLGLVTYPTVPSAGSLAPYWIVALWVLTATTLNYGLRWIKKSWTAAIVAGAVGGPLVFSAGAAAGAVAFENPAFSLAAIGAGWAVLLPLLVLISDTIIDSAWLEPEPADEPARMRLLPRGELGSQV